MFYILILDSSGSIFLVIVELIVGKMLGGFVNGLVVISLVILCCYGDDEC